MKDFFGVMGKAFAVVFGSTSALALVLVLLALAVRPVVRSWVQQAPVNMQVEKPPLALHDADAPPAGYYEVPAPHEETKRYKQGQCIEWDLNGRCTITYGALQLGNCDKDGCSVYRKNFVVGSVSREEITKAQWIPVDEHRK
ncbi:MAG: hypothetical protein WA197_25270 [Candidatus Acidiferrales bacterium]